MYVVFLNMTNMFLHQKIAYRDLGTAKFFKNSTTEKYLIINSMSEWIKMLIYEQEISNAAWVLGGLISYGSVWRACSAWVRIQLQTECFCEVLASDN